MHACQHGVLRPKTIILTGTVTVFDAGAMVTYVSVTVVEAVIVAPPV